MADHDRDFLQNVPVLLEFGSVADTENYHPLPDGWFLALADVVDSTIAIAEGRYKAVNMAGASVISALMNSLGDPDLPFVFGGDGAVVAIAPPNVDTARNALSAVCRWVEDELQFTMRAALVPVSDIRAAGFDVQVARYQASSEVSYAMFAGGGTSWADAEMKKGLYAIERAPPGTMPDLTGLSCRWNPVASRHGQILSIIVTPGDNDVDDNFRTLVTDIIALTSEEDRDGHPLPLEGPVAGPTLQSIDAEARATAPRGRRFLRKIRIVAEYWLVSMLHRFSLTLGRFDAREYRRDVARNTDFRKFDDGLKMTVDIDAARARRIEARLIKAAAEGTCRYGLHRQDAALMTCFVPTPLKRDHIHFIAGAAGGYAIPATRMKATLPWKRSTSASARQKT